MKAYLLALFFCMINVCFLITFCVDNLVYAEKNGNKGKDGLNLECNEDSCEVEEKNEKKDDNEEIENEKKENLSKEEIVEEDVVVSDDVELIDDNEEVETEEGRIQKEGKILYRLYFNAVQPSSTSVRIFLILYMLHPKVEFIEVEEPETDDSVPVLEILNSNKSKKLYGFNNIKQFLMDMTKEINMTWKLYTVNNCKPCTRTKNFLIKNKLTSLVKIVVCDKLDLKSVEGCSNIKQFPTLESSLKTTLTDSKKIISFFRVFFLNKKESNIIPRYPLELKNIGGKVMYPKMFSLYFFPGESEGVSTDEWVIKNNFTHIVERKPLSIIDYNNEYIYIVENFKDLIFTPNIIDNQSRIPIAMGYKNIKKVLLRLKLLHEPNENVMWSHFAIYSSDDCGACVQLKNILDREGLNFVRTKDLAHGEVRKQFSEIGGTKVPALSVYGQIQFLGALDIASFIAFIKVEYSKNILKINKE